MKSVYSALFLIISSKYLSTSQFILRLEGDVLVVRYVEWRGARPDEKDASKKKRPLRSLFFDEFDGCGAVPFRDGRHVRGFRNVDFLAVNGAAGIIRLG